MPIRSACMRAAAGDWRPRSRARRERDAARILGERFGRLYELTRRGEMQDFLSRVTPLDFRVGTWSRVKKPNAANSWYEATAKRPAPRHRRSRRRRGRV